MYMPDSFKLPLLSYSIVNHPWYSSYIIYILVLTLYLYLPWYNFRSGTEEDYSELTQLLQDIAEYERDVAEAQRNEKQLKKKKEEEEKRQAQEMRNQAMMTVSSK